jgi:hypothetical protein
VIGPLVPLCVNVKAYMALTTSVLSSQPEYESSSASSMDFDNRDQGLNTFFYHYKLNPFCTHIHTSLKLGLHIFSHKYDNLLGLL